MFKPGDRVKVYGQVLDGLADAPTELGGGYLRGKKAIVASVVGEDEINVIFDCCDNEYITVHPKQCRKIKAKKWEIGTYVKLSQEGVAWYRSNIDIHLPCAPEDVQCLIAMALSDITAPTGEIIGDCDGGYRVRFGCVYYGSEFESNVSPEHLTKLEYDRD